MELAVERSGPVEIWTIQGEARRNSLTIALLAELSERVLALSDDRSVRAVVLAGQGDRAFCAGADLKERARMTDDGVHAFHAAVRDTFLGIERAAQPFVAALNGAALGGGLELALACDLRVAAEGAEMGFPEVSLGIIPGAGGTARLPRVVGVARAKDLVLTARRIRGAEALAMGLVSRIAPAARVLAEATELALALARHAPISLRQAKRAIDGGFCLPLEEALALENRLYQDCLGSRDRVEALQAFAEKRPPVFRGE